MSHGHVREAPRMKPGARWARRVLRTAAVVGAALVAAVPGIAEAHQPTPPYTGPLWSPFPLPSGRSVPGTTASTGGAAARVARAVRAAVTREPAAAAVPYRAPRVRPVWPAAATGTTQIQEWTPVRVRHWFELTERILPGWHSAGRLPVTARAAPGSAGPAEVTVRVASRSAAVAAGVGDGVLLTVSAGPATGGGSVVVSLGYRAFAAMFGGAWASRLRLVELPGCALTSPRRPGCRVRTPLAGGNSPSRAAAWARVTLPAGPAAAHAARAALAGHAVMLALVSGPSGPDGNFTATPLKPSGTWAVQQGDFAYDYPIQVPSSPVGAAPDVTLRYDSQSIDSETSASNTQAGWIGDGWDYSPGFVERSYQPCSQDGISNSGDECWGGWNATLNLDGQTHVLVRDDSGTWKLQDDNGTKVELDQNADNGLWNGEYWVITTPDGTRYYFGANQIPGGNGSDPASHSAWGVPVYCPGTSDPCYDSTKGQASEQYMGWRWNLDYVVSPLGALTAYTYQQETNYYSMGGGQNGGNGDLTQYVRGGFLKTISYGWLISDAIAGASAEAQVQFTSSQRCTGSQSECSSFSNLDSSDASDWPDTPYDQICQSSGSCTNYSPTFFTTYMLTEITSEVYEGTGSNAGYTPVDSWDLSQSFPAAGTAAPVIFLNSITRTGKDGGSQSLPAVTFTPAEIDNRVDGLVPAAPQVYRPRIAAITTGSGAVITVTYEPPACSRVNNTMPAHDYDNSMPCFPVYWTPPGSGQIKDWFNKSLVSQVDTSDQSGLSTPSPDQVTSYAYLGGAAWHYDDSPLVTSSNRTWDQYRGYDQVQVTTGATPDPVTQVIYTYLRGMDGDNNGTGGQRSVTVPDNLSPPESYTDSNWLAGQVLETDTYAQAGSSTVQTRVINAPPVSSGTGTAAVYDSTATQTEPDGLPALTARMVDETTTRVLQAVAAGGFRTTTTNTYFDDNAQVAAVDQAPAGSPETCASTAYATTPSGNQMMLAYPDQVTVVTGAYSGSACPAPSASDIVSDTRYYYDDQSSTLSLTGMGTLGSLAYPGGLVTGVQKAATWDNSGEHWQPASVTRYDPFGRVTAATDGDGNTTTISYSPAYEAGQGAELPQAITVTDPAPFTKWTTTTDLDQARQLPETVTDDNGEQTSYTYDPLGRATSATLPIDQGSTYQTYQYAYQTPAGGPFSVTTQTLQETGGTALDVKIYDGMLQLRQEQSSPYSSDGTGRLITDWFYDSHGWPVKTSGPYFNNASGPSAAFFVALDSAVPNQMVTVYDGMGRPISSQFWSQGTEQWNTSTTYPGLDEADTTPPAGGVPTSSFTNALGQVTAYWQYTTATPDGNLAHADKTTWTYTPAGQVATVANNSGNTWTYQYNLLGQKTSSTDPGMTGTSGPSGQAGTLSYSYDGNGNLTSVTDPNNQTLSWTYDALNRKTAEYNGTTSGTQIASWTYDQAKLPGSTTGLARGQLYQATATPSGPSGPSYSQTVTGYNAAYEPTGISETLPESALIPGSSSTATLTYSDTSAYTSLTGEPYTTGYNADNGLPAETVTYAFDAMGQETQIGGNATYLAGLTYDAWGRPQRATFGPYPAQAVNTYTWDPSTGRLLESQNDWQPPGKSAPPSYEPDATTYTYNPAGGLTSVSDVQTTQVKQSSGQYTTSQATQTQCYGYGGAGMLVNQLTAAWTDTGGTQTDASPVVPGIGSCQNTTPQAANIGGPAPYWETWTYDLAGDRTSQTTYNTSLPPAQDTLANADVAQTTYPGGNLSNSPSSNAPTTPQPQPDAAQAVTTSLNSSVTGVSTSGYNANGQTTVTLSSGTTPLISAVQSGGSNMCAGDYQSSKTSGTKADIETCGTAAGQSFTVPTGTGQVKSQGLCLAVKGNGTTSGTHVEFDTCSSSAAGQKWTAEPGGSLKNPNSGMCLDDPGGNKTVGTQLDIASCNGWARQSWGSQQITWTPTGQIGDITTPAPGGGTQTASYTYDASGNLIAQNDPASDTIYLLGGSEQITYTPSTGDTLAQRFYAAPDSTVAVRSYDSKAGSTTISYDISNPQGTSLETINAGTGAVTRRYFDPYGQAVGTAPAWPDNRNYLGKPQDPATGFDLLGARQYNPATGAFLSLDPDFESGSPLEMGGYAYAANNPATNSDPGGLCAKADPSSPPVNCSGNQVANDGHAQDTSVAYLGPQARPIFITVFEGTIIYADSRAVYQAALFRAYKESLQTMGWLTAKWHPGGRYMPGAPLMCEGDPMPNLPSCGPATPMVLDVFAHMICASGTVSCQFASPFHALALSMKAGAALGWGHDIGPGPYDGLPEDPFGPGGATLYERMMAAIQGT
jgi:RHS repeat-associated protein